MVMDAPQSTGTEAANGVESIDELDEQAAFHFTVFSDGWGIHPDNNQDMRKREEWILENGSRFATTAGDHLTAPRDGWTYQFNKYIADSENPDWWRENFYPGVADHDVQYYTGETPDEGQSNWGAAWPMLDGIGMYDRENAQFAHEMFDWYAEWLDNLDPEWEWWDGLEEDYPESLSGRSSDYYVQREEDGVTFHLIIGHHVSSDGTNEVTGFPEQSKRFMIETLEGIDKGDDDVIIMTTQSWSGNFIDQLSIERQRKIVGKADLVFSGNQHKVNYFTQTSYEYQKWHDEPYFDYTDHPDYPDIALALNSGACDTGIMPGLWELHVFKDPLRMTVQYCQTRFEERQLHEGPIGVGETWPMKKVVGGPTEVITDWGNWDA